MLMNCQSPEENNSLETANWDPWNGLIAKCYPGTLWDSAAAMGQNHTIKNFQNITSRDM